MALAARTSPSESRNSCCRTVVVSSGSGGVGRSLFALQTALSLGEHGQRTLLVDANAGVSHTALLAGQTDWRSLDQMGVGQSLDEVAIALSENTSLVCGGSGILREGLAHGLSVLHDPSRPFDWTVIDAGSRTQEGVMEILCDCDVPVLVTVAEPISLAETYATLRQLGAAGCDRVSVVLNRVGNEAVGQSVAQTLDETAARFLRRRTSVAATLLEEPLVSAAARQRQAGHFLRNTNFGKSIAIWTNRLRAAA